ncbi:MAG: ABC-2 transporter permease [Firmicutes bacterium]|nr:ABC-2 transporter permease [Bacillota bacterium]
MKNLKALITLDYQLIRPYWKYWVMFFGIALFMSIVNQAGEVFMLSLPIFAATIMAFPFESADKSNLNVLYATLPTNRKSMVTARYIFIMISLAITIVLAVVFSMVVDWMFDNVIYGFVIGTLLCIAIAIFLLVVSIQTPFLYKHGYTKGRIFMWIPLIVVIIVINLPALFNVLNLDIEFNIFEIMFRNTTLTSILSLFVGVAAITTSYFVSLKFYLKKDF